MARGFIKKINVEFTNLFGKNHFANLKLLFSCILKQSFFQYIFFVFSPLTICIEQVTLVIVRCVTLNFLSRSFYFTNHNFPLFT